MNSPTHLSGEITAMELHHWLDSGKPLMLINVMGEGCFAETHIPGSARACVYETAFLDQVDQLNPDTGASIVVYGNHSQSLASQVAAEKLLAAGHTHVYDFRGGVDDWIAAGYEIQGEGPKATPPDPLSGTFNLDTDRSVVRWTGRNLLNHHEGTAPLVAGEIEVKSGELVRCHFQVDLRLITCADLTDTSLRTMLIHHLMDADFFDVAKHPTAEFTSTSAKPLSEATPGMPNYELTGDFTLRGQTHSITFPAVIGSSDPNTIAGQAEIDLDRTRWGALYGSGKFFDRLGGHLVNDLIHLHLKIVANLKD
ncbi:YceI family protein [Phragmitibacter flavus]|nr:YceI family protein [Phragmitibacter flavus]